MWHPNQNSKRKIERLAAALVLLVLFVLAMVLLPVRAASAAPSPEDQARIAAIAEGQWPSSPCVGGKMTVTYVPDGSLDQYAVVDGKWASFYNGRVGGVYMGSLDGMPSCDIRLTDVPRSLNSECRMLAHEWGHSAGEKHPDHGIMSPAEVYAQPYPPCDDAFPVAAAPQAAPAPAPVVEEPEIVRNLSDRKARAAVRLEVRYWGHRGAVKARCVPEKKTIRRCWAGWKVRNGGMRWHAFTVSWSAVLDEFADPLAVAVRTKRADRRTLPKGTA
jgi:hypothetical protein